MKYERPEGLKKQEAFVNIHGDVDHVDLECTNNIIGWGKLNIHYTYEVKPIKGFKHYKEHIMEFEYENKMYQLISQSIYNAFEPKYIGQRIITQILKLNMPARAPQMRMTEEERQEMLDERAAIKRLRKEGKI